MHEYEDEISKLRTHVAELESKSQERNVDDIMMELEQIREYSEQLQEQFAAQVGIIETLKRKIVQVESIFITAGIKSLFPYRDWFGVLRSKLYELISLNMMILHPL